MAIIEDTSTHAVAEVAAPSSLAATDIALCVHDPVGGGVAAFPTLGAATLLSVSGTSAATAALTAGRYMLVSTIDICWEQAASPTAQWLAGDSRFWPAGMPLYCTLAAQALAAITAGGSGTLCIIPVS